jgi:hypothetical protein
MKKIALTSLLIILSLPAFGTAANYSFTSDFNEAETTEDAYNVYKEAANQIIDKAKKDRAKNKEIKTLQEIRDKVLESKPGATSSTASNNVQTVVTQTTPEQTQEEKINELREKADAAKEKEQSTANKLLGGATMMATGMGAMELASSMSEQKADQEAEDEMRAYLSTFYCKYGNKRVPGGTKNAEIGGGNELVNLYAEYVNLANDLKARKTALDIAPGIESEAILNSATAGLYNDENIGKRGGMFTSLARALQDPTGEDAQKWKAQQEESAKGIKDGAIALGVGAVGSAVINLAMNHADDKDKDDEDTEEKELTDTEKLELCKKGGLGEWDADNKTCTCDSNHAIWGTSLVFNSELHICTTLTDKYIKDLSKKAKKELQTCNKSASEYVWNKQINKCVEKTAKTNTSKSKYAI